MAVNFQIYYLLLRFYFGLECVLCAGTRFKSTGLLVMEVDGLFSLSLGASTEVPTDDDRRKDETR
jgi:hypothetical protein